MLELVGQVLAYAGIGLGVLIAGFYVLDLLTPGNLGKLVVDGNRNAAVLASATLVSLGLIMWFAIFFVGAGWDGIDDTIVFGGVGVATQVIGFLVLDLVTPGKLGDTLIDDGPGSSGRIVPATWVAASLQVAIALIVCASLT